MYICLIYSSCFLRSKEKSMYFNLYQSVVRYIWEISQLALIPVKILVTHWQICGLQSKFQFLPQLSIKSIFSNKVCAGYLGNFTSGPILCSNLWLVVLLSRKFLLFLSLFGILAIKDMTFWEILIFSQQNLLFLKNVKWVM